MEPFYELILFYKLCFEFRNLNYRCYLYAETIPSSQYNYYHYNEMPPISEFNPNDTRFAYLYDTLFSICLALVPSYHHLQISLIADVQLFPVVERTHLVRPKCASLLIIHCLQYLGFPHIPSRYLFLTFVSIQAIEHQQVPANSTWQF